MMEKTIDWLSNSFAPKMNKINKNPWIAGIQTSVMQILPFILVGSLVTIVGVVQNFISSIPGSIWKLSSFSFGLVSIFISFLIPYNIMEKKKYMKMRFIGGLTGIALFLMIMKPTFSDKGAVFNFSAFGAGGMFAAIIVGLFVAFIMGLFAKFSFFREGSSMPSFVAAWFDAMLPITITLVIGWVLIFIFQIDIYNAVTAVFMPIQSFANTLPGFVLLMFIVSFFYSLGISSWVLTPVTQTIYMSSIAANSAAVAAGQAAALVCTNETIFSGWIAIGGIGATLPLVVMMLRAKSKKLRAIGKASIVPGILNINAWNPILMLPFWLSMVVISAVTWITLHIGLVSIPSSVFGMWYCPLGISTWLVTKDLRSLVLLAVNIVIVSIIYFPFFKTCDAVELKKEKEAESSAE